MSDPSALVHVVDELPDLRTDGSGPVLLHALDGFLSAGGAGRLAAAHLASTPGARVVASFDLDLLYDFRARRPPMVFNEDHYESYDAPRLVVRVVHDTAGVPYLLMSGPEPDFRWEGFAAAVRGLVERFGVRLTVGMGSVPMAVPHTRPITCTTHATRPDLVRVANVWRGQIRIPASAEALLSLRLGEWGHDAMGFVAHVPHYLTQVDYPTASLALLEQVTTATGLRFDLSSLTRSAADTVAQIDEQVAGSDEVREVVTGLEEQYDAFHRASDQSLLTQQRPIPTAEELGAEFERFLAGLDKRDDRE